MEYVTESDRYEREHCDSETKREILDSYTKYCRCVTYSYCFLVAFTLSIVIFQPLSSYWSSSALQEEVRNGTGSFPHIFSVWMPFNKNRFPFTWITVLYHIFISSYGSLALVAFDTNAVVIMVFFGGKLELLQEQCQQMLGHGGKGITDDEAFITFRHLHETYERMMKYSKLFNSLLSPVMFLYVIMCSLMLCASAYQLTSAPTASQKLLMAEYLIFGISQLFVFCWHSNDVLLKSENLMRGPYESEWWAASVTQRKALLLLTGQFQKTCLFTAGPFTNLTLYSFITILKGAYSYYTLLRD